MKLLRASLLTIAVALTPLAAHAQSWPAVQPIKVIVPFSAGSATDLIARAVFEQVGQQIGATFVVDNRVGAGGTLGANAVAKAAPDGYTLLVHSSTHTVTPSTHANPGYDTAKDFAPIVPLGNLPNVLVAAKAKSYGSLKDMVAAAKAKAGGFNYASVGPGSASHLTAERLKMAAKIEAQHVPFKGAPEALREIIADRIDFYFTPLAPAKGMIEQGELVALAVSSSQRATSLPNVPTTVEAGYPNSEYNFWVGVLAPAQTPPAVTERLSKEISAALANPGVKEKLARIGVDPMPLTSAQFQALIAKEIADNAELVKAAGLKPN